jgi:hypothetical protein
MKDRGVNRKLILGSVRSAWRQFASGGGECLKDFLALFVALLPYGLLGVVSRRVEAVHSLIQFVSNCSTKAGTIYKCARTRQGDAGKYLLSREFMGWLVEHWYSRDIMRKSLLFFFSRSELQAMPLKKVLSWWYQCNGQLDGIRSCS